MDVSYCRNVDVSLFLLTLKTDSFRINGPYFEMKIENVPLESPQEKNSPHRWESDIIIEFPNDR